MSHFISVEDALLHILDAAPRQGTERVGLSDAPGRYLAAPINAPADVPAFDNSAMDGIVVRRDDLTALPRTLPLVGESAAGHPADRELGPAQAMRISTGARIPQHADQVIPRELCDFGDGEVTVRELPAHDHIRRAGDYLSQGRPALFPGQRLDAASIGLLASFNIAALSVVRRPRVTIIATGDELVELGQEPGPGQLVNSNAYMIEALAKRCGATTRVLPITPDRYEAVRAAFEEACATSDLVLSIGGVSVGEHDHVRRVLDERSSGMTFWKIRMKPGKPLAFGTTEGGTALVGLPGNPASSFVGFQLFVRPLLACAQGVPRDQASLPRVNAVLDAPVQGAGRRRTYLAGQWYAQRGVMHFAPLSDQSSGNPALFAGATALGIVEEGIDSLSAGASLPMLLLPGS
ncbi:molybdopterin molybdotransferase MoeA [Lujinxingia litoralis]|nr:gephyrin-like molybdotransferase Glp [Lujinxingia litoralis]